MKYDVYFREKVIRKFIDESDWHPVTGQDYYRPLDLTVRQFYTKCNEDGYDWYRWDAVRVGLSNLVEMMDALEEWGYRFHTVDGLTDEWANKWGWRVTENGWVNYPDYQSRVFRNVDEIFWQNKVHERIVGTKTYAHLPPHEELSLYHPKTIKRQEKQNELYEKIQTT